MAEIVSMDIALSSTSTPKNAQPNFCEKDLKQIIVIIAKHGIFELRNYLSEMAGLW